MRSLRCAFGCDEELGAFVDPVGCTVHFCASCRSTFCPGEHVGAWLGGDLSSPVVALLPRPEQAQVTDAPRCPADGGPLATIAVPGVARGALCCERCRGVLVEAGALPALRAAISRGRTSGAYAAATHPRARSLRPALSSQPSEPQPAAPPAGEVLLVGDRLEFDQPWVNLLALPIALLASVLVAATLFGRMLLYPVQIQFHELGHAIPSWLSSRAALPLPFGFTFWHEDASLFTGMCVVFLLSVLAYYGWFESRPFAMTLAALALTAFVGLTFFVSRDTSRMLTLLGGIAGELVLSTAVMVAFFFPMPDRLRWDFFRFVVLLPAAGAWVSTARLWIAVARGLEPLPMGSIMGTPGDGSGDLDRLIAQHHFTPASLTHVYVSLVGLTGTILCLAYGWFALRAAARLRAGG